MANWEVESRGEWVKLVDLDRADPWETGVYRTARSDKVRVGLLKELAKRRNERIDIYV
jgi:hypothetical protein